MQVSYPSVTVPKAVSRDSQEGADLEPFGAELYGGVSRDPQRGAQPRPLGVESFVGAWHRVQDNILMASITKDGTLVWSVDFNKAVSYLRLVGDSNVELDLEGKVYSGWLDAETGILQWSDGDTWLRGFLPYAGQWFMQVDGAPIAVIHLDGRVIWSRDVPEESRITLKKGHIELHMNGKAHSAILASHEEGGTGGQGPNLGKQLTWNDGDVWIQPR